MNSTTSLKPGDLAYVPFWVVQEFLDNTLPNPFIVGKVLSLGLRHANSPNGTIQFLACDFEIKPDLIAPGLPVDYLIAPESLEEWANRISDWFKNYPNKQISAHTTEHASNIVTK